MKKCIPMFIWFLSAHLVLSQDINMCNKVVDVVIEAIDSQSSDKVNEHLSPDFSMAGQTGEIAKMVLSQLLSQIGETVTASEKVGESSVEEGVELTYKITYKGMGERDATFLFNQKNQLQELTLFKMEVKSFCRDTEVEKSQSKIIEIPFKMAGNLIALEAMLDGVKRTFILDTGAPMVILNSNHIKKDSTDRKTISSSQGIGGNISGMDISRVDSFDFGGIQIRDQELVTVDLSNLEEELEMAFYGLIGYDLIRDYDLLFDYDQMMLTLIEPDSFSTYKEKHFSNSVLDIVPIELKNHIPVIEAIVDGRSYSLGIDSGAESNLFDDDLFETLKKNIPEIETDDLRGVDNNPQTVKTGDLNKIQIGSKIFQDTPTVFSNISHLNEGYQIKVDGLIGYPILSKQKTLLSYKRQELIFIE